MPGDAATDAEAPRGSRITAWGVSPASLVYRQAGGAREGEEERTGLRGGPEVAAVNATGARGARWSAAGAGGSSAAPRCTKGVAALGSAGAGAAGACTEQSQPAWLEAWTASECARPEASAAGPQQQCPGVPIARHESPAGSEAACTATAGAPWAAHAMASAGAPPMVQTIARTSVSTSHRLLCRSRFMMKA